MRLITELLPDAFVLACTSFGDHRGSFAETFNRKQLASLDADFEFVQDNESVSAYAGTVRGLHYQVDPHAQGKLVRVLTGHIVDVLVDIRPGSPTYRQHAMVELAARDGVAVWVPPGFAHGFCTLDDDTTVAYKVTAYYEPEAERCIRWDDPGLGISWPPITKNCVVLSEKDAAAPTLAEIEASDA
jgi:dTDP-4-dehydrorhamnose 3,5-epimerase